MNSVFRFQIWRWCFLAVLCASPPGAIADDESQEVYPEGGGGFSREHEWGLHQRYRHVRGYADRPDDELLATVSVHWEEPTIDRLGNICTLRGRLECIPPGAAKPRPVDWFQGIALYVAKTSGSTPDWTAGSHPSDTIYEWHYTDRDGSFVLTLDVRNLREDRSLNEAFQFGLALAEHDDSGTGRQEVVWSSHAPAIVGSVTMMQIPAAPPISRELELLNEAAGWPFDNPDGCDLIRAVNALQTLGKEDALATLEDYLELSSDPAYPHDSEKLVFWVIRLLFEPIRIDDRIPPPMIAVAFGFSEDMDASAWPLDPMGLVGDVPFMLGQQINLSGQEERPESHIEWVRRYGVIRDGPLRPTIQPLAAAEMILADPAFQQAAGEERFWREQMMRGIKGQAMVMVQGLVPIIVDDPYFDDAVYEAQWRERVEQSIELGITWDDERQEFVIPADK